MNPDYTRRSRQSRETALRIEAAPAIACGARFAERRRTASVAEAGRPAAKQPEPGASVHRLL